MLSIFLINFDYIQLHKQLNTKKLIAPGSVNRSSTRIDSIARDG